MQNIIKYLRGKNDIPQKVLAKQCGVTRQTIHAIENNKYDPTLELAFELSKQLNTPVDNLFKYE